MRISAGSNNSLGQAVVLAITGPAGAGGGWGGGGGGWRPPALPPPPCCRRLRWASGFGAASGRRRAPLADLAGPAKPQADTATLVTIVLIGLFWGLNWPAMKVMLTEVPPFTIRAVALTGASLVLAAVAGGLGHRLLPPRAELPWMALTGLLSVFGFNVLVIIGQTLTEASRAAIIAYTMPAMTAVLSALLLGERLSGRRLAALALGMAGIGVLASEDWAGLIAAPAGALVMLGSALSWALGTVAMKAGRFTLAPMPLTVWFLGLSALASWPLVAAFDLGWWRDPVLSWPVAAVWAWHLLLPMVICYALWTSLVGRLPASLAAIATLLAPFVGVASAVILLGEPLGWQKAVALALVLGSIALGFLRLPQMPSARQ
jgi:drug/metabolite transporter (DMT)-like permease